MTDATTQPERAKRQLVVCCDGTNNNLTGQVCDTNVVKLLQLMSDCDADPHRLVFYDPGVGNPGELPGATLVEVFKRWADRVAGLAFGQGVYQNMAECYLFLMRHYRPGDEIFIFGFSRGAFTARSVAGLVNQFGILQPQMASMVTTLLHIYFSERKKDGGARLKEIGAQATRLFAAAPSQKVDIQFVGVWDTVDSVGMWPFQAKMTAVPTIKGKRFLNVRHAMSLDEHRSQFKPRLYVDDNGTYLTNTNQAAGIQQLWFRGAHCDVGGGYPDGEAAISNRSLEWMVSQAVLCGLSLTLKGQLLNTEEGVTNAWQLHTAKSHRARVHSQLYPSCLWALTGMAVRQTDKVYLDVEPFVVVLKPEEHPSVGQEALVFPADTVWSKRRGAWYLYVWLLIGSIVFIGLGALLSGQARPDSLAAFPDYVWRCVVDNLQLASWQLSWWWRGGLDALIAAFASGSVRAAVMGDFAFVAAYAYALSWFCVAAFARKAGLRRAASVSRPWLNCLGLALPVMVGFDLLENLLTLTAITLQLNSEFKLAWVIGIAMSLASLCKFLGFAGVIALLLPARKP